MGGMNGSLDGIISELTDMLGRAEWSRDQAKDALAAAEGEVRRIKSILKAAGVEEEPAPDTRKPRKTKPARVNPETRGRVMRAIRNWNAGGWAVIPGVAHSFTAAKIAEAAADLHESSVRTAISNLRDDGIIRAVGLVPNSPRKAPMAYVLGEGNEASE